ncbi:MAG: glycoside hydrolase family 97 protein [Bacteroidales bacterium]|nr:glycoside hydrolase family 97 protein [Bacteroidales bacterium]
MPLSMAAAAKDYKLSSPDGKISVSITAGENLAYSVSYDGKEILAPSKLAMNIEGGKVFGAGKVRKVTTGKVEDKGLATVAYKKASVDDVYNFTTIAYSECSVEFRAYDDAVAYRFVSTAKKGEFNVASEDVEYNFADNLQTWVPYVRTQGTFEQQWYNSFENTYEHIALNDWNPERLAFLPVAFDAADGVKVLITESGLVHYPGLYLSYAGDKSLKGVNALYPAKVEIGGHNNLQGLVLERESYIAKAAAGQKFPWRILSIVPEAKDLANLDIVWKLSEPADPQADWSWVKPGKVAWDWWNDWNISGVDFRSGINNDTYKYYIDFASEHGIEYVILDEGWAVNKVCDLYQIVPEINLEELVAYAQGKNVDLILWAGHKAVEKDIEGIFKHYSEMGIKGFKIDFMDHDDQQVVEFYENCARLGAKYHLLLDFHGAFKPSGLQRTYPNVVNYEGVHGLEQVKWIKPDVDQVTYDVTIPFIRMAAGSMDYTQGAMRNANKRNYFPCNTEPMSQGTRCRQLAEYAIFDAPLTMMCDSPSAYMAEPECTEFIAAFPTTWDETVAVCGEIGDYVAIARKKDGKWYVGALTDWDARDLELDLSFIGGGKMTIFQDGVNADKIAKDYKKCVADMPADGKVKVHMAPGGGWVAVIE